MVDYQLQFQGWQMHLQSLSLLDIMPPVVYLSNQSQLNTLIAQSVFLQLPKLFWFHMQ